jgi:ABC-type Co2+ transport system permease subunit
LLGYNINVMFDLNELVKRAIKYLIEGLVVALAAFAIPKKQLNVEEIIIIALTAAATFSILDVFIPAMGSSARGGAGFGIGANLVGGLKMAA